MDLGLKGRVAIVAAALCLSSQPAGAAVVTVGSHVLLANTPNQSFTIPIVGVEQVAGEDFFAQIGDISSAKSAELSPAHAVFDHHIQSMLEVLTDLIRDYGQSQCTH